MTEDNYYLIGRALLVEFPEEFIFYKKRIKQLEAREEHELTQIPALYESYGTLVGACPGSTNVARCNLKVITHHRLFIAAVLYLYDPLYFHNINGRSKDRLRSTTAQVLTCSPEWISNVLVSISIPPKVKGLIFGSSIVLPGKTISPVSLSL